MDLTKYEGKYVRIRSVYGDTLTGRARYEGREFLECEWGGDEDGLFIEDFLIYNSQIASLEEIKPHGTVELWTEQMVLRRYRPEDAEPLYRRLGTDPAMAQSRDGIPTRHWKRRGRRCAGSSPVMMMRIPIPG